MGKWVISFKRIVGDFSNLTFTLAIGEKHFYNSKGSVRKNMSSYFVSVRQEGGGTRHHFCLKSWKNELMFENQIFC